MADISSLLKLFFLVCFDIKNCHGQHCKSNNEADNYIRISTLINITNAEQNGCLKMNSCELGRLQKIPQNTCYAHCSMRNNCIAVSNEEYGCRLCYNNSYIPSLINADPENTYVKLDALDLYNSTLDLCINRDSFCTVRNGQFQCSCPRGTMGNNCTLCDMVHRESCYKIVFTPKTWGDASDHCAIEGGHLVDIADDDEYETVFNMELDVWHESSPLITGTTYYASDSAITASGIHGDINDATQSRLDNMPNPNVHNSGAWCIGSTSLPIWIQVQLHPLFLILKIATRGLPSGERGSSAYWVTSYKVQYSSSADQRFRTIQNGTHGEMVFKGNEDNDRIKYNVIPGIILAKYVRLLPETWNEEICLRWELYD